MNAIQKCAIILSPNVPQFLPGRNALCETVIAPETIDRIREQANLASVIGESVKLERRGRSLQGLCPFHKEKSPSFHVNEDRGFYHCFGCKASGDVFKFIQETEGLSFIEAVRSLGDRMGIEVESDLSSEEQKQRAAEKRREQALYDVTNTAAAFFETMLLKHEHSQFAHRELEKRGLPMNGPAADVLRSFRVGYAPESWEELANHLRRAGHDLKAAEAVGLIAPRRQGQGYYDRFRHRLMFAVIDLHGRVVAFSGRALPPVRAGEEEAPAKYYNSPESPIYQKRATVFGLYQSRQALRSGKPCVIVEGNFDVVSLHAKGFTQAVAPLGTAFTLEQGKLVRRFTSDVTFLFDGDSAGRKATVASRDPAREAGLRAKVARLPDGVDPDDFARSKGEEGVKNLLGAASGMLDYLIAEVLDEGFVTADAVGRAEKIKEVIELLKSEDDPNVRAMAEQHADRLAGRLGVADAHTFRALRDSIRRGLSVPLPQASIPDEYDPYQEEAPTKRGTPLSESIIGVLLDFPELLDSEELLAYSGHMEGDTAAAVACLRMAHESPIAGESGGTASGIGHRTIGRLPGSLQSFAAQRLAAPVHDEIELARVELFANLDKLRHVELTRLSSSALGDIERARKEGDFDQELALLKEQELRARRRRGL